MEYQEEDKQLYRDFLDRYYFRYWQGASSNYRRSLELYVGTSCNLKCKYCYLSKYGNKLYDPKLQSKKLVLSNLKLLLEYFEEKKYKPDSIEVFGGDMWGLVGWNELLQIIYDYVQLWRKETRYIAWPLNVAWIDDERSINDLIKWKQKFYKIGVNLAFSFSMDGYYADPIARPPRVKGFKYDMHFYDKVTEFARQVRPGFHPMIAPESIHVWRENFDWYVNFIARTFRIEHKEAYERIYLLEVRNPNWNKEQLKGLSRLIYHLVHRMWQYNDEDPKKFFEALRKGKLNIFTKITNTVGRGIGCSIQETLSVRLGDLHIVPCHRLSHPGYESGKFIVEDGKIMNIEPVNFYFHFAILSSHMASSPVCSSCPINSICSLSCLGANLEFNKSAFIPIPSMCRMEYTLLSSFFKAIDRLGLWGYYRAVMETYKSSSNYIKFAQSQYLKEA